ncbi:MAG: hypothetical protein OXH99_13865 [Bryobacterales bacterium]|nr:hypothetical protein [Bryobacterales bacterium]
MKRLPSGATVVPWPPTLPGSRAATIPSRIAIDHPLNHHGGNPDSIEKVTRINTCHAEQLAVFLDKLKGAGGGDGTLLDRSMIVCGCGLSDGNRHTHENLPIVLARRGGGLHLGRHVRYAEGTPVTNLFLTLLDRMGVRPESIGDSTGHFEHISDVQRATKRGLAARPSRGRPWKGC